MRGKFLDSVYMMVLPKDGGIVYRVMGSTPGSVWETVVDQQILGTGFTKKLLHRQGYRVKKVEVYLP